MGLLATGYAPSKTYAEYTRLGCEDVGIEFVLKEVHRTNIEQAIESANQDKDIHGIIIYYPIFGSSQDNYIKDLVDYRKDIEGLNTFWLRRLYSNERFMNELHTMKAILPCTPLAVMKMLEEAKAFGPDAKQHLKDKTVTIFNRSEVVGRPLASMMANDGAKVYSFDISGPLLVTKEHVDESKISRADALKESDIIITGVPSRDFPMIEAQEIGDDVVCLNFSTVKNFTVEAKEKAKVFVPRVGPMTVTMALRNTLRLYNNYHGS